jgi:integrase
MLPPDDELEEDYSAYLSQLNHQLKSLGIGVRIRQKGNKLYLRATLPPKPGSRQTADYQQEISLDICANIAGFKLAKLEALTVWMSLESGEFDWQPYLKRRATKQKLVHEWIKEFEADYFDRRERNPKSETTYDKDYRLTFKKLPQDIPLTAEGILELVKSTKADSRNRKRYCIALQALARFAGVDIDLKRFKGTYNLKKTKRRNLPDDDLIEEWREKILNPAWQWVYGMLAVYGLRPHEVFNLDLQRLSQGEKGLRVLDGKTGARLVYPFPLAWWEKWRLWEVNLPVVTGSSNSAYGCRVQQYFKRSRVPFHAYDLRHCFAIRAMKMGLNLSLAAQQSGHSVAIHTDLYHRWISEKTHQEAFEALNSNHSSRT